MEWFVTAESGMKEMKYWWVHIDRLLSQIEMKLDEREHENEMEEAVFVCACLFCYSYVFLYLKHCSNKFKVCTTELQT